ncbi:MAG: NAD-dependent epimerase/dehydratase family protein [Firmicutes bacterium]|nr:NAD-dependent epimerase/dehydratase family protein [Bacillota bacterium]
MRLRERNVLVTGGAGFMGYHLCRKLAAEGARVKALDLCAGSVCDRVDLVNGNIACAQTVTKLAGQPDIIVHLAYPMALRRRVVDAGAVSDSLAGLINLINLALERDALLVYVSSIAVYGNGRYAPIDEEHPLEPVLLHGAVKQAGEAFCQVMALSAGLKTVILRVADIYGPASPGLSVPIKFLLQAMRAEPITVYGDGSDRRTYTYVDDFTEAVVLSITAPGAMGDILNIGGDWCVSMLELARAVNTVTGGAGRVVRLDCRGAGRNLHISSEKAKRVLGYQPAFQLEEGLTLTCRWLKDNPDYY